MEHEEAVHTHATEKYLLGELLPEERDAFEEHLFDCRDCADDLRAAAAFVEHSKVVLSTPDTTPVHVPAPAPAKPGWLSWLRPAIAAPVLAGLLAIVAYQGLVSLPRLKATLQSPQVLPAVYLVSATRGNAPAVTVAPKTPVLVSVDIPATSQFTSYAADLYDPAGSVEWSLAIPSELAKDSVSVRIPPVKGGSGTYTLVVRGSGPGGVNSEVGRYPFELRLLK